MTKNMIVIPTYNEAGNLALLVQRIRSVDPTSTITIVDDNSPDGTGDIAETLKQKDQAFEIIHRSGKLGLGSAHMAGMRLALERGFDTVTTMDCDFTHKPEHLPDMQRALQERGDDIVIGSRYLQQDGIKSWPWSRRLITRTAHFMTTYILGLPFDATNAYRIYRLSTLPFSRLEKMKSEGYSFMFELLFICRRAGLKISQIPMELPQRHAGESKISKKEIILAVKRLFSLFLLRLSGVFDNSRTPQQVVNKHTH